MNYKCNNYHSSYCFIDNKPINTIDYEKIFKSNNSFDIKCHKNHSLIFVNGKKRIPHFRHKNTDDIKLMIIILYGIKIGKVYFLISKYNFQKNQIKLN